MRVDLVLEERAVGLLDGLLEQALGFIGIEDGEVARQPDGLAIKAQRAVANAMKSAAPKAAGLDAGELVDAVKHFLGGLVGEGEEQDFAGAHALGEQVGHAVGEGAGLPRTGTGEHEQGTGRRGDGRELLVVELGAEVDRRHGAGGRLVSRVRIHEGSRASPIPSGTQSKVLAGFAS